MAEKLKLAHYWTAACGGCDVAVLDLADRILDVAAVADLVFWPVALDFKEHHVAAFPDGHIDVCLFNGAIRNSENLAMAKLLRQKSKTLVAFGSCAQLGGIPGLANLSSSDEVLQYVFERTASTDNPAKQRPLERFQGAAGELSLPRFFPRIRRLDQVVPVDYYVPGCPPVVDQVWNVIAAIAEGKLPERGAVIGAGETALCDACPREKSEKCIQEFKSIAHFTPDSNRCLLEQGVVCCGPATRSGCGALCIKANMPCRGCYGPLPGVADAGAKLIATIGAAIDAEDEVSINRILDQLEDPAGTFYRFSLPAALHSGAGWKEE